MNGKNIIRIILAAAFILGVFFAEKLGYQGHDNDN